MGRKARTQKVHEPASQVKIVCWVREVGYHPAARKDRVRITPMGARIVEAYD
jgi:hypothetical protein